MNLLLALEHLGYTNTVDFEIRSPDNDNVVYWNSDDDFPDQATLEQAIVDYEAANPQTLPVYN